MDTEGGGAGRVTGTFATGAGRPEAVVGAVGVAVLLTGPALHDVEHSGDTHSKPLEARFCEHAADSSVSLPPEVFARAKLDSSVSVPPTNSVGDPKTVGSSTIADSVDSHTDGPRSLRPLDEHLPAEAQLAVDTSSRCSSRSISPGSVHDDSESISHVVGNSIVTSGDFGALGDAVVTSSSSWEAVGVARDCPKESDAA